MKCLVGLILLFIPLILRAEEVTPLRIAISSFAAPYIMQGNNQQFYGFDISMMSYVCKALQRRCIYVPMTVRELYPAILNKKVDLAVSTILISSDKLQYVQMSMPYMIAESQFIGPTELTQQPFTLKLLDNKRLGVVDKSAYDQYIKTLSIQNLRVIRFDSHDQIINALRNGRIDFGLFDSHIVKYWQDNSSGYLHGVGNSFPVGNGLGILANIESTELILEVNNALVTYQSSGQFKEDYQLYLENF